MRYRQLSPTGDFVFGQGSADYYINVPEAPAQAAMTRLLLLQGEWFLDVTDGTPYSTEILGLHTKQVRDQAIRSRILGTEGIIGITSYSSAIGPKRDFQVLASLNTQYGQAEVEVTL